MAQIPRPVAYQVDIMEYERGWDNKLEETLYFDNESEAKEYCRSFNSRNLRPVAPDWYMVAEYRGRV